MKREPITEYDSNRNLIYCRDRDGNELWKKYDSNGNCIHIRDHRGDFWRKYDANNRMTYSRDNNGFEAHWHYDADGKLAHFSNSNGEDFWYWKGNPTKDPIAILLIKSQLIEKATQNSQ